MGAYSRWAPIRGRALIRIKNYVDNLCPFFFSILFCWSCFNKHFLWIPYLKIARKSYVWMYLPFISSTVLKACLHGGGGPQVGEVTRLGGVTRLSIQSLILMWSRLHVRWDNLPHVTSPTWGPPASCKQALKEAWSHQNITVFITLPQFVLTGCFFLPRGPFSFCPFWSNRVRTLFWTKCSKTFQGLSRTHFPFLKHSIQCKKEPWVCLF